MALDGAGHAVLAFDATGVKQFATSVAGAQHGPLPAVTAALLAPGVKFAAHSALP